MIKELDKRNLKNVRILLRCDLNVPFDENDALLDSKRITTILPTIKYLLEKEAIIILISHLGRPKKFEENLSLQKLIPHLKKYWRQDVKFIGDITSRSAKKIIENSKGKSILLAENIRFHNEESENDKNFAAKISEHAEIYINDAFSCSHRKHASICSITQYLQSYPGILMEKEIMYLNKILENKEKPITVIVGGKKLSSKFKCLEKLSNIADHIIITGAMANTFLKSLGKNIGTSFYEEDILTNAKKLFTNYNKKFFLPIDVIGKNKHNVFIKKVEDVLEYDCILDIGTNSANKICDIISKSKLALWSGPIGFYESEIYRTSSLHVAKHIAYNTSANNLTSVIGGGDAAAVAELSGLSDYFTHISTGGSAFLEFIAKGTIIGISELNKNK